MRSRKPVSRDMLDNARETLVGADQCAVFDVLFDAALRAVRNVAAEETRLNSTLNGALDGIYAELTRSEPMQAGRAPEVRRSKIA